ncbi:MAG: hypothetical protein A2Y10_04120 [Planctomycetes bacterium GWF2_41_51]|nr:MAG: hypothetical protein A2Y10_04120 [Planctomycetes bacterium GWF2_41_51]HBG26489.1 isoprenylcysteine carboxylmethyltransferase family protein [Phycisphaerales bacterium]
MEKMLFIAAKLRVPLTRIVAIVILLLILFTTHSWKQDNIIDIVMETCGLLLITLCSFGRLWALMYISGYKSDQVISVGPYSIVRHPLYVFSFIGAIGIGLASENLLIFAIIAVFYICYYPFTILAEEKKLTSKFGQAYIDYMKCTPRILPKLTKPNNPVIYHVKPDKYIANFADAMWFVWIFILLHFVERLQQMAVLPVIFKIP